MPLKTPQAFSKSEKRRLEKLTEPETLARSKGYRCVAGVDEAGRGPLAGPVLAAACTIRAGLFFAHINDSKLLTPKKRKILFEQLTAHEGVQFGVGRIDQDEIDKINIYQATLVAMRLAVAQLQEQPDVVLVDGMHLTIDGIHAERIVKGDQLSQMIAAASIIAKESRDQIMIQYHETYPEYGFDEHKGYGTEKHRAALHKYGPCPLHRRTFHF